ncbi:hypothetical protein [Nocardioides sp. B-3]|uniref:hypothetical protein n=1 Tax=Nocardioides sp. B-3 TaxID=2895565 RepID=UPI0021523B42|nr:hypothetical protein [Nocardioides sp. B-3]UUZ61891.1 hypothetical protein LP418_15300 [Nocardioides sp. B-3]
MALLSWLEDALPDVDEDRGATLEALRAALAPFPAGLPERLKQHLEKLMAVEHEIEKREIRAAQSERIHEHERAELEEALRRLLRSLRGAPRPRRKAAARGVVDGARTIART